MFHKNKKQFIHPLKKVAFLPKYYKYIISLSFIQIQQLSGFTMPRRSTKDKKIQKTIARRRINQLFSLAEQYALSSRLNLANRYVEIARKISMRYLVPMPREYKRRFCKHCYHYLLPHVNSRVRIHRGKLITYCHHCKKYTRIPLKNPQKVTSAILK